MKALPARRLCARTFSAPAAPPLRLFALRDASFYWDGAVGLGEAARIDAAGPDRFAEVRRRADALFAATDGPAPPLYGGFAFASGFGDEAWADFGDASFVLPRWLYRDGSLTFVGAAPPHPDELGRLLEALAADPALPAPEVDRVLRPPRAAWARLVDGIRDEIAAGRAEKIVAARRTAVLGRFHDAAVLARLPAASVRFAFRRGGATFLGATPERLLRKQGPVVWSEALAGTATGAFGDKDRAEHAPVVREILAALARLGARAETAAVEPRRLADFAHLCTPIRARLPAPAHVLDVAAALHPTPAVGGAPRAHALEWIRAHESPRGWYAGAVGWLDAAGDGDFAVALRCGLVTADRAHVHAGAGIVAASDADAEDREVALKERGFLRALGASL